MKRYKVILLVVVAVLTGACTSTYPDSFIDDGTVKSNDEVNDIVSVQISLTDPLYSVYTRGVGSFMPWTLDSLHWLNAKFRAFGYATANGIQGTADYSQDTLCLLKDHIAHLQGEYGQMWFSDESGNQDFVYFKKSQYNVRYRFFMYHADDAVLGPLQTAGNTVKRTITLDGSQDLIHGIDQPTEIQQSEAASILGVTTSQVRSYLYSYRAGLSGINPIVPINHLLCQMDVVLTGSPVANDSTENGHAGYAYLYQKVVLNDVALKAPTSGTLTIADDSWTADTYAKALDNGTIFAPDENSKTLQHVKLISNPVADNMYTRTYNPSVHFDILAGQLPEGGVYHHLNSKNGERDTLSARPILLVPAKSYIIQLGGYWADDIDASGTHCTWRAMPDVKIPVVAAGNNGFQRGHHYTLLINMYGPQKITLGAVLDEWIEGGKVYTSTLNIVPADQYEGEY